VQWNGRDQWAFGLELLATPLANGQITAHTETINSDGSVTVNITTSGNSYDLITVPVGGWVIPSSLIYDSAFTYEEWYPSTDIFEQKYRLAN
jgi:hypothetical protein